MYRELPSDPKDLKHVSDCFDLQYLAGIRDGLTTLAHALWNKKDLKVDDIINTLWEAIDDIEGVIQVTNTKMVPLSMVCDPFQKLQKYLDYQKERDRKKEKKLVKSKPPKLTS